MKTSPAAGQPRPVIDGHSIYVRAIAQKAESLGKRVSLPSPVPAPSPAPVRAARAGPRAATPVSSEFFEER